MNRTGSKLGGKLNDQKSVLAERLAHWLNRAVDAGRKAPGSANDNEGALPDDFDTRPRRHKTDLVQHVVLVGEVPLNAGVTAEQAESALGRTFAT